VAITYAKDASAASAVVKAIELDGGKAVAIQVLPYCTIWPIGKTAATL